MKLINDAKAYLCDLLSAYGDSICNIDKDGILPPALTEDKLNILYEYLIGIAKLLVHHETELYNIKQKDYSSLTLSNNEETLKKWCEEFNLIKEKLILYINNNLKEDGDFWRLLYELKKSLDSFPEELL